MGDRHGPGAIGSTGLTRTGLVGLLQSLNPSPNCPEAASRVPLAQRASCTAGQRQVSFDGASMRASVLEMRIA
jgi:hypothetical protein